MRYEIWNGNREFIGYYYEEIKGNGVYLKQDIAFTTKFGLSMKAQTVFYPLEVRDGRLVLNVRRKSKRQVAMLIKHGGERCERRV